MWNPNALHLGDIVDEHIVERALALVREQLGEVFALGLRPDGSSYAVSRVEESQRGVTGIVSAASRFSPRRDETTMYRDPPLVVLNFELTTR
jgi:hypothetical protein